MSSKECNDFIRSIYISSSSLQLVCRIVEAQLLLQLETVYTTTNSATLTWSVVSNVTVAVLSQQRTSSSDWQFNGVSDALTVITGTDFSPFANGSTITYTVPNLLGGIEYMFQVAITLPDNSTQQSTTTATTQVGVLSTYPSAVLPLSQSSTSFSVTWLPPAPSTWNGILKGYNLFYKRTNFTDYLVSIYS